MSFFQKLFRRPPRIGWSICTSCGGVFNGLQVKKGLCLCGRKTLKPCTHEEAKEQIRKIGENSKK